MSYRIFLFLRFVNKLVSLLFVQHTLSVTAQIRPNTKHSKAQLKTTFQLNSKRGEAVRSPASLQMMSFAGCTWRLRLLQRIAQQPLRDWMVEAARLSSRLRPAKHDLLSRMLEDLFYYSVHCYWKGCVEGLNPLFFGEWDNFFFACVWKKWV